MKKENANWFLGLGLQTTALCKPLAPSLFGFRYKNTVGVKCNAIVTEVNVICCIHACCSEATEEAG